ncbi:lysophosphatidylserine lipase ABHD12 [Trichonephila clavata]|uniref:Lysophosphatidylserine lipase ABHD12 n=1 Tax=Trichonephila clavata TaxID=2740835 RepID=A0A8X6F0C3_TRICU|nr:lysophosphatidylserine lipase ABHD12 [Trichonephila clavata]
MLNDKQIKSTFRKINKNWETLSHPEYYGLNCTRHFFVETSPGVLLGVWHIPPATTCYQMTSLSSLSLDDQPVILYLHGSAESRSAPYRRNMYNVLTRKPIQAHVITFDYRGFGDSTYLSPTAKTLEEDATAMFQWLKKYVPTSRIIVWGHSMGTGIAIRLSQALANDVANNLSPLFSKHHSPVLQMPLVPSHYPFSTEECPFSNSSVRKELDIQTPTSTAMNEWAT